MLQQETQMAKVIRFHTTGGAEVLRREALDIFIPQ